MSTACKQAAETGEAWVTWRGERLRLVPLPQNEEDYFFAHGGNMVVVYVRQGRFRIAEIGMRKGSLPMLDMSNGGNNYRIQPKQLRALVVERHVVSQEARDSILEKEKYQHKIRQKKHLELMQKIRNDKTSKIR